MDSELVYVSLMWLLIECYLGSVLQFRVVKVH